MGNEDLNFIINQLKSTFSRCFWPEPCTDKSIKAHSIQNRRVLDLLAKNGEVIMPSARIDSIHGPHFEFKPVGRNKASTFNGLCNTHDSLLFKPIDAEAIDLNNLEHLFLIGYRSVLKTLHATMKAAIDIQTGYLRAIELGKFNEQTEQPLKMSTQSLLKAYFFDIYKRNFDEIYMNKSWGEFEHSYFIVKTSQPCIAVSSVFSAGDGPEDPHYVVLNIYPEGSETIIIFSYLPAHRTSAQTVFNHLLFADDYYIKYEISKLVLAESENFVISPTVFESMSKPQIAAISKYFAANIPVDNISSIDYDDPLVYLFGTAS